MIGRVAMALFVSVSLTSVAAPAHEPALAAARAFRAAHGAGIVRDHAALLAIPSVAADPAGLTRMAEALRDGLRARGASADTFALPGAAPVVIGRLDAAGAKRTLGIYLHYDGQPVDPAAWTHPPFEPTLYTGVLGAGGRPRALPRDGEAVGPEWRLYARAASDDKAPATALFAALDALERAGVARTSNLVFLFEGEEEAGSQHLGDYLDAYRERLAGVELWLICDGPVHTTRRAQLVFGVRGVAGLEIRVYGALRGLHSGHYGNWAPMPAVDLARLVASFKDADGRVQVAGFYDDTVPPSAAERAALARLPDTDAALAAELGIGRTEGAGAPLAERLMLPSLNVRGLSAGNVGATAANVIPPFADASIDLRLAAGDDPERMLDRVERHVAAQGFFVVHAEPDRETRRAHPRVARVTRAPGYPALRTPLDLPVVAPVIDAMAAAAGEPPLLVPTLGGSLPLATFQRLGAPLVIVPIVNHDNNQHAADENLRLANLWYGIDLYAALLAMPPGGAAR